MKIIIMGGSGGMGRAAVRTVLTFNFVTEVVVAGIDGDLAKRFVASLKDPRVRNLHLDVTDTASMRKAISEVDVVLNAAGPFFRFGVPILDASIEEGKHYCDICDDWQPTVEMLKLGEKAKARGITAVVGMGASPGILNLLCVKAANELDEVDDIVSAWKLSGAVNDDDGFTPPVADGHVDAAAVHLVHCLSEEIRVVRNGEMVDTRPLEHTQIDFPTLGNLDIWSLGHPEAVTLPRSFPNLQNCYNGMLGIDEIVDDLREVANAVSAGQLDVEDAARMLTGEGGREERQKRLSKTEREDVPGALAFASGRKNGQPARAGAFIENRPAGGMATITGIPLALFLPLLHNGSLKQHGVFAPEEIIDPDVFFELLDPFCGPDGAGLKVLTSS